MSAVRSIARAAVAAAAVAGAFWAGGARADATPCSFATSKANHTVCWIAVPNYSGTGSANLSITTPDGSTLTTTLSVPSTTTYTIATVPLSFNGSSFANTGYAGVPGLVSFGTKNGIRTNDPATLGDLVLTGASGTIPTLRMIGVDAESTDGGDDSSTLQGGLGWKTSGTGWSVFEELPPTDGNTTNAPCQLAGIGTANATCKGTPNAASPTDAYALQSDVQSGGSIVMYTINGTTIDQEAFTFGIDLASLAVTKNLRSRDASSDAWTIAESHGTAAAFASASTGTGSTAAIAATPVTPQEPVTVSESASSGTNTGRYVSSIACTNGRSGSSTALPSGVGRSFTFTPAIDDAVSCTFTNDALSETEVAVNSQQTVSPGETSNDAFTFTNTTAIAATLMVNAPTIGANGTTLTPTGYTYAGKTFTTLQALQAALNAAPLAPNGTATVGVTYAVPSTGSATVTLTGDVAASGSASATSTATETDTLGASKTVLSKTVANLTRNGAAGTSNQAKPGDTLRYALTLTNDASYAVSNVQLADAVPAHTGFVAARCTAATSGCAVGASPAAGGSGTVTWTFSSAIAAGATVSVSMDVVVQ